MYICQLPPNPLGKGDSKEHKGFAPPKDVFPVAKAFIKNWKAEFQDGQIYINLKCFPEPKRLYVNSGLLHIEGRDRNRKTSLDQIARRYRFLPCVRELLENTTDEPQETRDLNYQLLGKARPYNEEFKVIIGMGDFPTGEYGYRLVTFYPVKKK